MKTYIIILFLIIILISGCSKNEGKTTTNEISLPSDFTISFYVEGSSGGGDRYARASLTFQNNQLISGSSNYKFNGFNSDNPSLPLILDVSCSLDIKTLTWNNEGTNDLCSRPWTGLPLNKYDLQIRINSGEYKLLPQDQCPH